MIETNETVTVGALGFAVADDPTRAARRAGKTSARKKIEQF
jgi:hypothetical protein